MPNVLFERFSKRIVEERHVDKDHADRIMDQALVFLGTCATTDEPLSPSETVDISWHTFILHTHDYAAFGERMAGRFIHHVPTGDEDPAAHGSDARPRSGVPSGRSAAQDSGWTGTCGRPLETAGNAHGVIKVGPTHPERLTDDPP